MDSYSWLLTRLLVVSAGLAVAILSGSLVAAYGISVTPLPMVADIWIADAGLALAARNPPFLVLVAACLAQIVTIWKIALIGVVATEVLFLRSWMFQAANGAASGFLASHLYTLGLASGLPVVSPDHMLTAGLVGGLAYWAVAGWNAGFHTPSFELPPAI